MNGEEKYADAITELQAQRLSLESQIASVDTAISLLRALSAGIPIPSVVAPATGSHK
jgi:hypothetical protein